MSSKTTEYLLLVDIYNGIFAKSLFNESFFFHMANWKILFVYAFCKFLCKRLNSSKYSLSNCPYKTWAVFLNMKKKNRNGSDLFVYALFAFQLTNKWHKQFNGHFKGEATRKRSALEAINRKELDDLFMKYFVFLFSVENFSWIDKIFSILKYWRAYGCSPFKL